MPPLVWVVGEFVAIVALLLPYRRLLPSFSRWLDRHPVFGLELVALLAIVYGVGREYGLQDLYWHERFDPQFLAGASLAVTVVSLVLLSGLTDPRPEVTPSDVTAYLRRLCPRVEGAFGRFLNLDSYGYRVVTCTLLVIPAFTVLLAVPAAGCILRRLWGGGAGPVWTHAALPLGFFTIGVVVLYFLTLMSYMGASHYRMSVRDGHDDHVRFLNAFNNYAPIRAAAGVLFSIYIFALIRSEDRTFPPAWALCYLMMFVATASAAFHSRPLARSVAVLIVLGLVAAFNSDPYKLSYPGLEVGDARPVLARFVGPGRGGGAPVGAERGREGATGRSEGLLDDREVLDRWLAARTAEAGRAGAKPKLVVVAVSGGGIAAAVWTALNLVRLEEQVPGFPRNVRLITGASGGMLGAAYYTATLTDGGGLTRADRTRIVDDLARDSLTPVLTRLIRHDLPSIVIPGRVTRDRGRELERTWEENTGGTIRSPLARPFRELARGEAEGWRPSLIVSPMLVEEGGPMLISNLDLGYTRAVEFFKLFPAARFPGAVALKVSTAVRMNAAFPFVSPATNLPTVPPRRVVDAGYFDNYGIVLAAAWIDHNRDWLAEHTSGVALVQIRAYPDDSAATGEPDHFKRLRDGLQWFTTPLEGYAAVNRRAAIDRNDGKVTALREWFAGRRPAVPFHSAVLQCPESAALSWYMTAADRSMLRSIAAAGPDRDGGGGRRPVGAGAEAVAAKARYRDDYRKNLDALRAFMGGAGGPGR